MIVTTLTGLTGLTGTCLSFSARGAAVVFLAAVLGSACQAPTGTDAGASKTEAKANSKGDTRVIATYGQDQLTAQDFIDLVSELNVRTRKTLNNMDKRAQFVENQVVQELIYGKGKELGYDRDDTIRKQVHDLERRLVIQKVMLEHQGKEVGEEEVKAYYDTNRDEFSTDRVRASHILVKDEELASKILAQIEADPSKFEALAEEHSIDKSNAAKGGDLGFFGKGRMVTEFEDAAFSLGNDGALSKLVETRFGYHIIKRTGREDGFVRPFEEVKNQVRIKLANERRRLGTETFLAKVKEAANYQLDRDVLEHVELPEGRAPTARPHVGH